MFLPRISLLVWILAFALAACGDSSKPKPEQLHVAEVVAGTGDTTPEAVDRVREVVATELASLQKVFDKEVERFFVHVHASRDEMPEALVAGVNEQAPGFAVLGRHQIHLILDRMSIGATLRGVVRHELVHELLDQYAGKQGHRLPRWFHEGLAQLLAGDTYLDASEDDLVWRVGAGSLPSFRSLEKHFPTVTIKLRTAYAVSYSYVAWLSREYGVPMLLRCARYVDSMTSFGDVLVGQTGRDSLQLQTAWQNYVLYGSGATWRVVFGSWFSLLMILVLPVLVLALMRRLRSEQRAARHLAARARSDKARAEEEARRMEQMRVEQMRAEQMHREQLLRDHGPDLGDPALRDPALGGEMPHPGADDRWSVQDRQAVDDDALDEHVRLDRPEDDPQRP